VEAGADAGQDVQVDPAGAQVFSSRTISSFIERATRSGL
jgi:hypothetical protein